MGGGKWPGAGGGGASLESLSPDPDSIPLRISLAS